MIKKFLVNLDPTAKRTLFLEVLRSIALGVIDTAGSTFFLLYMVRVLGAGEASKTLVVVGSSIGLLLSPLIVQISAGFLIMPTRLSAFLFLVSGALCLLIPFVDNDYLIAFLLAAALATYHSATPLAVQIYADNYPAKLRGKLFSIATVFRIITSGVTAYYFGDLLSKSLEHYNIIFPVYSFWFFVNSLILIKIPSKPLASVSSNSLVEGFSALRTDKLFRLTIISWMFLGFGNLMLFPLRVEFLANPRFGNELNTKDIALFVSVIPNIFRLICVFIWGMLFDRMNFFRMRILVNTGFMLGTISFFFNSSWNLLFLGAALYGISTAGADIAWNLWVTKFAPLDKSKAYMAVHTFFTGLRGILAPMFAYYIVAQLGFEPIVYLGLVLMLIANVILVTDVIRKVVLKFISVLAKTNS